MTTAKEIWDTLSSIDVSKHIEKKGSLSYLSWAWAWGTLMEHFPQATYRFHGFADGGGVMRDVAYYPDGSAAVECEVSIGEVSHTMWLPVMDNRNNAVKDPDARKISDTKMRCLVKCIAMFGLGHYIYAGEDLPGNAEPAEKPKSSRKLKDEGAWEKVTSKIDAAEDTTHLDLIMKEIAPEVKGWNETYKRELREHCSKKRSELEIKDQLGDTNVMAAG